MDEFSQDAFIGYVAAFMDGEGSIIFRTIKDKQYIRCVLTNTHEGVLLLIQKRLGYGTIWKKKPRNGWKCCFFLAIDGFDTIERFLKMIRPYLVIKADKADAALAVIEKRNAAKQKYEERNRSILAEIASGKPQHKIAKAFGLSQQGISTIKLGHAWPSRHTKKQDRILVR